MWNLVPSGVSLSASMYSDDMVWYLRWLLFTPKSLRLRFPDCTNSHVAYVLCLRNYNILLVAVMYYFCSLRFIPLILWNLGHLGLVLIFYFPLFFFDIILYHFHLFLVCSVPLLPILFFGYRLQSCILALAILGCLLYVVCYSFLTVDLPFSKTSCLYLSIWDFGYNLILDYSGIQCYFESADMRFEFFDYCKNILYSL